MAAHYLHVLQLDTAGATLTDLNLNTTSGGGLYLRSRQPSLFTYKDQRQSSPTLNGEFLADFARANQRETIICDIRGTTIANVQTWLNSLNVISTEVRRQARNKHNSVTGPKWYLSFNPLAGLANTSKAELVTFDAFLPENYLEFLPSLRIENVVLELEMYPYWTASVLNLISAQAITNTANKVIITDDQTVYTVTTAALTSNVATLTVDETVTLAVGETILVANVTLDAAFNGTFVVSAVGANTISYPKTNGDIVSASSTGSVEGKWVEGSREAPLRIEVVGGTTNTNKLMIAARTRGTPANFTHQYWAKDATLTNNTVTTSMTTYTVTNAVLTSNVATLTIGTHQHAVDDVITAASISLDAAFDGTYTLTAVGATTISYALVHGDIGTGASTGTVTREFAGNTTGTGTRTTAADTVENKTHRWVPTSNVADQFGAYRVWLRSRSNTASRYSARLRVGLSDGTNVLYPEDGGGGYSLAEAETIGTSSGNNLAFTDLGTINVPAISSNGATVYGLVYELYLTCSSISGSPTCDVDGIWLFPVNEGAEGTGVVKAKYQLGTAASGVSSAFISALPSVPAAYLANSGDVPTFPTLNLEEGSPLFAYPGAEHRLYFALIDEATSAGNPRLNHLTTLTVTVDYEIRHGAEGRLD